MVFLFLFFFFLYSFKYVITEKELLTQLSRFFYLNKKQILQPNNHLMARMFWFHKEVMDLDVESACSHCGCADLLQSKNTVDWGHKIARLGVND